MVFSNFWIMQIKVYMFYDIKRDSDGDDEGAIG